MPPISPGVLPVSVPYNPANSISGNAPSLYIPQGSLPKETSVHTPSPTTSTPTNAPLPLFTISSSQSETHSSASSASQSPSTMYAVGPAALSGQGESDGGAQDNNDAEGESQKDGEVDRVQPYVDFTPIFRQVELLGEEHVYGWDKSVVDAAT